MISPVLEILGYRETRDRTQLLQASGFGSDEQRAVARVRHRLVEHRVCENASIAEHGWRFLDHPHSVYSQSLASCDELVGHLDDLLMT
jgi:hypothetical protein